MDVGAYAQIGPLNKVMSDNGIGIPRLRGLRLMSIEDPYSQEDIDRWVKHIALRECEMACEGYFQYNPMFHEFSTETKRLKNKYLLYAKDDEHHLDPIGVNWKAIHGKKRKLFKYRIKNARRRVVDNVRIFNKYCGRHDVLYIHARIGGYNWKDYDGPEIEKQEWFLERIDDPFDDTYCDIYAKIKPLEIRKAE